MYDRFYLYITMKRLHLYVKVANIYLHMQDGRFLRMRVVCETSE